MNNAYNMMQVQKRTGSKDVPRASFKQDASAPYTRFTLVSKELKNF